MNRIGIILLAIWLILTGLIELFKITFPAAGLILALLALAAGILLLIGSRRFRISGRFAVWVLAAYLILAGLLALFTIDFPSSGIVLGLLALAAGVLLMIER
jgi:hypothetical protein